MKRLVSFLVFALVLLTVSSGILAADKVITLDPLAFLDQGLSAEYEQKLTDTSSLAFGGQFYSGAVLGTLGYRKYFVGSMPTGAFGQADAGVLMVEGDFGFWLDGKAGYQKVFNGGITASAYLKYEMVIGSGGFVGDPGIGVGLGYAF